MLNKDVLHNFILKVLADEELQKRLLEEPRALLIAFGFTSDEAEELHNLIEQGTPLGELDQRMSKYLFGGGGGG